MNYKGILKSYGLSPRKRFGQNFLIDKNIADKIVDALGLTVGDAIIEIGPGLGVLTEILLGAGVKVLAIEIDRDLAAILEQRLHDKGNLEIINADALKVSYKELADRYGIKPAAAGKQKLKLVSNLPYNISTPIIFKLLEERETFSMLLLMLQKEVAERIVSQPGTKDYGILSVFVQLLADVQIEFDVSPCSFYPMPNVQSSVVRFNMLQEPRIEIADINCFKRVVKASFGQRRKTLLNALKALKLSVSQVRSALELSHIDPQRRGETLTLEEFGVLSNNIKKIA
jgi:16S rRNA (adenine1518-N6/adenine1519-N6)-dimethyltransferase